LKARPNIPPSRSDARRERAMGTTAATTAVAVTDWTA
jgi:hypothetical protein